MSDSTTDRTLLEKLAEEFVARHRAGEQPSLDEYAERYPQLTGPIRELFPRLIEPKPSDTRALDRTTDFDSADDLGSSHPKRIGEFRILREVGRGGMGIVYEAVQESLGRHVALKVLPAGSLASPQRLERFQREAKAAAKLHHTNIVPVFGTGEAEGMPFYAMQFITGAGLDRVLQQLVQGKPHSLLDPSVGRRYGESVARLGAQAAAGLAHAHGQGVLHRDIKPGNLILDPNGTLWITDFGLAKLADEDNLTAAGDILGTLRYMAPERFQGCCDARADIYALGLTLYEMLTLKPAFADSGREQLIAQVTRGQPVRPSRLNPRVPRDLETIVLKAIAREPKARYATATEMADDLQRFIEDRPIHARRASAVERLYRWSRRNPVVAGLTAVLALFLIVAAVGSSVAAVKYRIVADDAKEKGRELEVQLVHLNQANRLFESGTRHARRKEWPEALGDYTEATRLRPDHSQVWSDRGLLFLRLGLADEAAADFARLFEVRPPDEPAWWYFHAALRLHVGDIAGYRAVCRQMQKHFAGADTAEVIRLVVQTCTLGPGGCDDPAELLRQTDQAAERFATESFTVQRTAALYRAGKHAEVLAATNPTSPTDRSRSIPELCFRALSMARSGDRSIALAALTTAREKLDAAASILSLQSFGRKPADRFVGSFPPAETQEALADWVSNLLLWQEASSSNQAGSEHPLGHLLRARGCAALGWWDRADEATERAGKTCLADGKSPIIPHVALVERARLNAARDRWEEVQQDLQKAAKAAPQQYPLSPQITLLYTAYGRDDDARRHLSEVLARAPSDLDLRLEHGQASARLGDWKTATEDLNAILTDPIWTPRPSRGFGGGFGATFFPEWRGASGRSSTLRSEDPRKLAREEAARNDEVYARLIERRPQDWALRLERGRYLIRARRWPEAVTHYTSWVENANSSVRDEMVRRISEDVAAWDRVFEPLVGRLPNNKELWRARGRWHLGAGDVEKAADAIVHALPLGPESAALDQLRERSYSEWVRNEDLFRALVSRRPKDGSLWMVRFQVLVQKRDWDGAESAALEVLHARPNNAFTLMALASTLEGSVQPDRAVPYYVEALKQRPNDMSLEQSLYQLNFRLKKWDEAAAGFGRALRLAKLPGVNPWLKMNLYGSLPYNLEVVEQLSIRRPKDGQLLLKRCQVLINFNKWQEATPLLVRAAELEPMQTEVWLLLAAARCVQEQWKEAATAYDKALNNQSHTNSPPTYNAIIRHVLSKPQGKQLFTALTELRPNDWRLWQHYGNAHLFGPNPARRQEYSHALDEMVRRGSKDPLAWVERARVRESEQKFDEAIDDFLAAAKLLPGTFPIKADLFNTTQEVYGHLCNNPLIFEKFTAKRKDDPFPWYFRAQRRASQPWSPGHAGWEADLDRALALRPRESFLHQMRSREYLNLGQWKKAAAACAAELKRQEPGAGSFYWLEAACAFAAAGEIEQYRALCRRMETVWGEPKNADDRERLAEMMTLLPESQADRARALKLVQAALKAVPAPPWWYTTTAALAHCRLGQYEESMKLIAGAGKTFDRGRYGPQGQIILELTTAIVQARRDGRTKPPLSNLQHACAEMDRELLNNGTRRYALPGHTWAYAAVLRREAEALLKEKPEPAKAKP